MLVFLTYSKYKQNVALFKPISFVSEFHYISNSLTSEIPFDPLSPHDALKHHLKSIKTDLIFLQLRVLEGKFLLNWSTSIHQYMVIFFNFSPTSNHLHPLQVENCGSNSRLVMDEDDNGKVRLERVKFQCRRPMAKQLSVQNVMKISLELTEESVREILSLQLTNVM